MKSVVNAVWWDLERRRTKLKKRWTEMRVQARTALMGTQIIVKWSSFGKMTMLVQGPRTAKMMVRRKYAAAPARRPSKTRGLLTCS
uniref:Uncharacterized protein n=1 Tax=Arundo donax TaxID=35708 RepID=A0A0A9AFJ2_ARUDO